jgi:hypothetical protein
MFDIAIERLNAILVDHPWASELAGILPLSALIEFIEVPSKLHIFQLSGATPLWSWPITPAGSRLLLAHDHPLHENCYLDHFGNSTGLLGLDGRYGDRYILSNPATVRLALDANQPRNISNAHANMARDDLRLQNLEVVHVERRPARGQRKACQPTFFPDFLWMSSARYLRVSAFGWILWLAMGVMSVILQTWLSLAFIVMMPVTGVVVFTIYGNNPRRLLVNTTSDFNRLIVVAEHENTANWKVFLGESTILNSLLNRPLELTGSRSWLAYLPLLRTILRASILGQWSLALGAASLKDWNAYFITIWIIFCISVHAYVIPPPQEAKYWCESSAGIQIKRYTTTVSSRRALLNTIIALNPDTFTWMPKLGPEDRTKFQDGAMKWVDRILERGSSRTKWEQATLKAMNQAPRQFSLEGPAVNITPDTDFPNKEWKAEYKDDYWMPFIHEGIYMAALIREKANLPGRRVRHSNHGPV